jgi:diguanylate cyclase (GGDEF)-like protein
MAASEKSLEHLLQLPVRSATTTRSEVLARALRTAILLLDADAAVAVMATPRGKGERLVLYAGSDTPAALPSIVDTSEALRTLAAERQALQVTDLSDRTEGPSPDACPGVEAGPVLFVPVDAGGTLPAYLAVYRKRGRARCTAQETELLLLLAAWLGAALENLRHSAAAEKLVLTDESTQLYNARFLDSALHRELRRADRHGQELSVVRVRVDALEAFRETHGNARAARLLKRVATILARQVRSFDLLGKDGANEFVAILPQTGRDQATEVAERMRMAIVAATFAPAIDTLTATFGVSSFPQDGIDADGLRAVAERALEQGSQRGGNCVATAVRKAA